MQSDTETNQLDNAKSVATAISEFTALQGHSDGRKFHNMAPNRREIMTGEDMSGEMARKLLDTLRKVNYSLTAAISYPISDQRVVSLYKESSKHEYAIHKAARNAKLTLQSLHTMHESAEPSNYFQSSTYGVPLPSLRSQVAQFVLASLSKWAAAAKLEYFLDENHSEVPVPFPSMLGTSDQITIASPKEVTVSLSTEQLLVDFVFERDRLADNPRMDLPQNHHIVPISLQQVKITVADKDDIPSAPDGHLGGTLHGLLEEKMRAFLLELGCGSSRAWDEVDSRKVEGAAAEVTAIFHDLNQMVEIMKREGSNDPSKAMAWWDLIPSIADRVMSIRRLEHAALVGENTSASEFIPCLDVFVLRCGAIPFPYLNSLSLGLLPYIPPLAYLTLLRNRRETTMDVYRSPSTFCDIPILQIRSLVANEELRRKLDIPVATLSYDRFSHRLPGSSTIEEELITSTILNPFPLDEASAAEREELARGILMIPSPSEQGDALLGGWKLDIIVGGRPLPLIVSQSRMKRLAAIIGLHSVPQSMHNLDLMSLGVPSEVGPSWLDFTIDPWCTQPSRAYTSRYSSRPKPETSRHTDFVNTLNPVTEPGFALGPIPIQTLGQAFSILSVVKEQLWLRGMILGAGFQPGFDANQAGLTSSDVDRKMGEDDADKDAAKALYESLLNNTYVPTRLRATYDVLEDGRTGIRISFPLGGRVVLVEVVLDFGCATGVQVTVNDERIESLEEVVRRGGLLGLVNAVKTRFIK